MRHEEISNFSFFASICLCFGRPFRQVQSIYVILAYCFWTPRSSVLIARLSCPRFLAELVFSGPILKSWFSFPNRFLGVHLSLCLSRFFLVFYPRLAFPSRYVSRICCWGIGKSARQKGLPFLLRAGFPFRAKAAFWLQFLNLSFSLCDWSSVVDSSLLLIAVVYPKKDTVFASYFVIESLSFLTTNSSI